MYAATRCVGDGTGGNRARRRRHGSARDRARCRSAIAAEREPREGRVDDSTAAVGAESIPVRTPGRLTAHVPGPGDCLCGADADVVDPRWIANHLTDTLHGGVSTDAAARRLRENLMSGSIPLSDRRRLIPAPLVRILLSPRLSVRFATLLSLGVVTFVLCQAIAFWWLPEGLLRGRSAGTLLTGDEAASSFIIEWARIAAFNLVSLLAFYVGANLIRFSNGVPLGYGTVIVMQGYFGIVTGTNSFTMLSEEGKIAPSFHWLLTPGFYELAAYALAAAATYEISRWQDVKIDGKTRAVRIQPAQGGWRNPQLRWGLAVAVVALVASNGWEANVIIGL